MASAVDRSSTVIEKEVVSQHRPDGLPIPGEEALPKALHPVGFDRARPARIPVEPIESLDRGVEVVRVEQFGTGDQTTLERQKVDIPPLRLEAVVRQPLAACVTTAPVSVNRCTASTWILVSGESAHAADR